MAKTTEFMGGSKGALQAFPKEVRKSMGYGLYVAEAGDKAPTARPMKGFRGASVLEIVDDYSGNTYRVVYTTKFTGLVVVLHAFMKKSKRGIATPLPAINLIKVRLRAAETLYR